MIETVAETVAHQSAGYTRLVLYGSVMNSGETYRKKSKLHYSDLSFNSTINNDSNNNNNNNNNNRFV